MRSGEVGRPGKRFLQGGNEPDSLILVTIFPIPSVAVSSFLILLAYSMLWASTFLVVAIASLILASF